MAIQNPYGMVLGDLETFLGEGPVAWVSGVIGRVVGWLLPDRPAAPSGTRWVKAWFMSPPRVEERVRDYGWLGDEDWWASRFGTTWPYATSFRIPGPDDQTTVIVRVRAVERDGRSGMWVDQVTTVTHPNEWGLHYPADANQLEDLATGLPVARWVKGHGSVPLAGITAQGYPFYQSEIEEPEARILADLTFPPKSSSGETERNEAWSALLGLPGPTVRPRGSGRPVTKSQRGALAVLTAAALGIALAGALPGWAAAGIAAGVYLVMAPGGPPTGPRPGGSSGGRGEGPRTPPTPQRGSEGPRTGRSSGGRGEGPRTPPTPQRGSEGPRTGRGGR